MSGCKFCAPVPVDEWNEFKAWMNANPYEDHRQVDDGMSYMLKKNKFYIACNFDGGYIGETATLKFNFCPMCGRPL